jgi:hypothetical protein
MTRSAQEAKANVGKSIVMKKRLPKGPSTTSGALVNNRPTPKAPVNAAFGKPSKSVSYNPPLLVVNK